MLKKLFYVAIVGASVGAVLGTAGCGGGGSSLPASQTTAHVRFLNSAPDSTSLNFALNGQVDGSALAYLASTPGFVNYGPNTYDISATEAAATAALADDADALNAGTSYVVVGYGLENFTGPDGPEVNKRFDVTPVQVDTSVPNGNKARIIVFAGFIQQFGFDTPTIDFEDGNTNPQYPLTNIAFGASSSELVNAGSITFDVFRDGTSQEYVTGTPFTFVAGKTYLALVTGLEGGTTAQTPQIKYIALD